MTRRHDGDVGVGVLGARSMVATRAVMPAIDAADGLHLAAVSSLGGKVDRRWRRLAVDDYGAVVGHPDVDAVYVPLPNGMHVEWVGRAAAAGRHALCEKPLAPDAAGAERMRAVCTEAGVLLAEAWMTPFHRRWSAAMSLAASGVIGDVTHQTHRFTFTIPGSASSNYRWRRDQGGGALLDVGIYTIGSACALWGPPDEIADVGIQLDDCADDGPVDASTRARLVWSDGRTADVRCSFVDDEAQRFEMVGSAGRIVVDGDAYTGGDSGDFVLDVDAAEQLDPVRCGDRSLAVPVLVGSPDVDVLDVTVRREETAEPGADGRRLVLDARPNDPYRAMVERFGAAVRGDTEWPRPATDAVELLALLTRIRSAGGARASHDDKGVGA